MPYAQVTRAQLRTLLLEQLGNASSTFWRTDELNNIIQETLRFFNLCTGFWKGRAVQATTAGTVWYALPGALISGMRVGFNGFTLGQAGFYDLDFGRPTWESEQTADGGDVPTRPQVWVLAGLNLIGIWPADAVGNNSLEVDGVAFTPILSNDASVLDLGQEELSTILDLMQHVAVFKEGGAEFKATEGLFQLFLKNAGERSSMLRASATYRKFLGLHTGRFKQPYKQAQNEVGAK